MKFLLFFSEINQFADMLPYEFSTHHNGLRMELRNLTEHKLSAASFIEPENILVPEEFDWREQGAVTAVKDQGQCGSCWAFSATGSLEGQNFRKTGELVSLSEQNLLDCSSSYGNEGCNGGLMDNAFKYIQENHGIDTEDTYPYEAEDDTCKYDPSNKGAEDKGYVDLPKGNEQKLKAAVATIGPISIAIDASHQSFQFYASGIYFERACSEESLDHGVLIVGYGTENGKDYWLVKNSWGAQWGHEGYIKMARNRNNNCGVASSASYPIV